jgi:antitoxin (DNA-binding transcriptional repressor) of toxin-antitoxin stability system
MPTVNLKDAQAHLAQIIAGLNPGEAVVITDQGQPLAQLVRSERTSWPCKAGSAAGKILHMAEDFDAPLEDFKEYME